MQNDPEAHRNRMGFQALGLFVLSCALVLYAWLHGSYSYGGMGETLIGMGAFLCILSSILAAFSRPSRAGRATLTGIKVALAILLLSQMILMRNEVARIHSNLNVMVVQGWRFQAHSEETIASATSDTQDADGGDAATGD